jgi:hypothetical protein
MQLYKDKNIVELTKHNAYQLILQLINDPTNTYEILTFVEITHIALKNNNKRLATLLLHKGRAIFN